MMSPQPDTCPLCGAPGQAHFDRCPVPLMDAINDRARDYETDQRRMLLRYAAVFCSCRLWYDWDGHGVPPQAGCPVHGNVMITMEGTIL